jgi:MFS family permease
MATQDATVPPAHRRPYRTLFRQRYVTYIIVTNLVGRLPTGMAALAIALFLRDQGMSFSVVGGVVGSYAVATAVGGPLLSRAVDRQGQGRILPMSSLLCSSGFIALAFDHGWALPVTIVLVVICGLCYPPLEPCLRSVWPSMLNNERSVAVAYTLDASLQQILFVAGPMLTTIIALSFSPTVALVTTGLLVIVGTALYVVPAPVRQWRAEARTHDWAGPLRVRDFRYLLISMGCVGFVLGIFNIGAVKYAETVNMPIMSGVLLGAHAIGSLLGGIYYGGRQWNRSPSSHLALLLAALTVCYLPLPFVPSGFFMTALMGIAGLFLAPVLAAAFVMIGEVAPSGTLTEAAAWLMAIVGAGVATGSAVAGAIQQFGLWLVFTLPAVGGLCAVTTTVRSGISKVPQKTAEEAHV